MISNRNRLTPKTAPELRLREAAPAWICGVLLLIILAMPCLAGQWQVPAAQLAQKIAAATGPASVAMTMANRSSLSDQEVDEIRRGLLEELAAHGIHLGGEDQAAATLQITLSENLQSYVWVAEIQQGRNQSSTVMVVTPRASTPDPGRQSFPLTIHKALLWSDEDRILDVALPNGNPPHMIILDPETIMLYVLQAGRWQQEQSLPVVHSRPWPRDMRGRLVLRKDHLFDAYLPGFLCHSTAAPLGMQCAESDDPWPLAPGQSNVSAFFAPTRNFFTGALSPAIGKQTTAPPFYSAAALPRDKYTLWVFSAVDGQVHWLDGMTDQLAGNLGWGSDLAAVHTSCGLGWQILATGSGNGPGDDVRAFEIADRAPVAVSQPMEFSGTITALWPDAESATAIAVSHDEGMGRYEAYRLSLTCGQ